jgi:uncharacterized membrane protein (DUF4010 family)
VEVPESWLAIAAAVGVGLLIGLERERNPVAKAGLRTFALVALLGALAQLIGARTASPWAVAVGLAAVAGMLIAAYARDEPRDDPGTTTVVAAAVCYCLGVLAAMGEPALAAALGVGVTALLYFKPELEGLSAALSRQDLLSILQFSVLTFVVLPILPDRAMGPYGVLNPHHVWLMVVLISGVGLASYVALRAAGERQGAVLTGLLGGLVSSTATTVLYARRSTESEAAAQLALVVVLLANLMPIARVAVVAAILAPAILGALVPVLAAALGAGLAAAAALMRRLEHPGALPAPAVRNPTELGTALRFGALYAVVLVASAWLADVGGSRGLYAAALAAGFADVDSPVLSALNLYAGARVEARVAVGAIAAAIGANVLFKLAVFFWIGARRVARRAVLPMLAVIAGGAVALALRG